MRRPHLIVTGGGGYIGRALLDAALADGRSVTVLARSNRNLPQGVHHVPWQLGDPLPDAALDPGCNAGEHVLVHLAHDWRDRDLDNGVNITATRRLRDDARRLGLGRLVFASSQSSRADALNAYGKLKWRIEQLLDARNEVSLRIGLVYGGLRAGQYGLLCRLAMLSNVLPMVVPHQSVQPVHAREVAGGILHAVDRDVTGALGLAAAEPIPFSQVFDVLAWRLRGGHMRLIPLPLGLVLRLCDLVNALPAGPKVDRERILGLAGSRASETREDLARLGLDLMPFAQGMLDEPPARRAVLAEGRAFLRYVLRAEPGSALLRRYARAVRNSSTPGALRLLRLFVRMPRLIRLIEPINGGSVLAQRLAIALALAEASPQATSALESSSRLPRLLALTCDLIIETLVFPARVAATVMQR